MHMYVKMNVYTVHTVLSRASTHGRSQLKCQKLRVSSYTENVLEWFD